MWIHARSWYSLRHGTVSVPDLIRSAADAGYDTLCLADIHAATGVLEAMREARGSGVTIIPGMEFHRHGEYAYTGIALSVEGFNGLNTFLTRHQLQQKPLPALPPWLDDVVFLMPPGTACTDEWHDQMFTGLHPAHTGRLRTHPHWRERAVWHIPVTYTEPHHPELHRHLRAIDLNCLLEQVPPEACAPPEHRLQPMANWQPAFHAEPQITGRTAAMLARFQFNMDLKAPKNRRTYTGNPADDRALLRQLAYDGMLYRYGRNHPEARRRVEHELGIIDRLGFSAYFLITWDVVRYSMSRGFYHVGRGSGANSVVAYCLRITDVDPIELDLYFERFLNPKRTSPPDFDIDYSWKDRDEVLRYMFHRYGHEYTALLGTISTFRGAAIIRELGKVYGLPKAEIDALSETPNDSNLQNPVTERIFRVGKWLSGFPNHRSIHAGGVLISEAPITTYSALDLPPKGFPTVQWDMYTAEEIGFEKFDILSQRGIGHIQDAADLVLNNRGLRIDVHDIPRIKRDTVVQAQLRSGDTIGCFYIESPAMRGLLKKLRCADYLTLVAASSIIRPGVARSGMMRAYIERFHDPKGFSYIHPIMEAQLHETYGVMVYQEDVLKICHHFAGLDLADADVLRRAMSGKFRSRAEFDRIVKKFFSNCRERGYPEEITREVWRQIESFAGYSFSKAHSASYAVESFQSLYLKSHFPQEFMVAVINNFGGFYATWVYVHEAIRTGAQVHLPCVNRSERLTSLCGTDVFLGLGLLQGLPQADMDGLLRERERNGAYRSMDDVQQRVSLSSEGLRLLIRAGALRFTGQGKKELLWHQLSAGAPAAAGSVLLDVARERYVLPALDTHPLEDVYDEIELLGFPVSCAPFDLLQTAFRGEVMASGLEAAMGRRVRMVGNLVTTKPVTTVKGERMSFGTWLDAEGRFFDTVHFPDTLRVFPFRGRGIYLILGRIVEEFGFPSLEVEKMAKLPVRPDPRAG